jgi:hypothetical protein
MNTRKIIAAISAIIVAAALAGCTSGNETADSGAADSAGNTAVTESMTEPQMSAAKPVEEGDAFAVDKLEFGYMPEGWGVAGKLDNAMVIVSTENQIDIQGINYVETLADLDAFADSCMAVYKLNNMLYHADLTIDEPYHTTVGTAAYDAVVYDFEIAVNEYDYDSNGAIVTDAAGNESKHVAAKYGAKAVFFYSGVDAYYMIFQCNLDNFDRLEPEFEKLLANITVNEDIKASDTTAVSTIALGAPAATE